MEFNLAQLNEAIAAAIPNREALVFRDKRFSFAEFAERSRRLANHLLEQGLGLHRNRYNLNNWESGQDHVGILMLNGNEYLESMYGAFKSRIVPFNINYRYVEEELIYLLKDANAKAIIYHAAFAPSIQAVRNKLPTLKVLIQVADESKHALLPDAVDYETALTQASPEQPDVNLSPDDLYMLYTGGTTGMPKGVLWRQADIINNALAGQHRDGHTITDLNTYIERAKNGATKKFLPIPPFMHGAGHWSALSNWHVGNTLVIQSTVASLDAKEILTLIDQEQAHGFLIVGDAFALPLLDEIEKNQHSLESLRYVNSSGAALCLPAKQRFLKALPRLKILDLNGSSESGNTGRHISTQHSATDTSEFEMNKDAVVLNAGLTKKLDKGHEGLGWWAKQGYVPLGYLGDEQKTTQTFPSIEGVRYAVPGDRVRLMQNGSAQFHGRDSVTINSGGEKIFAEELEQALKHHPDVFDTLVTGRPSLRWGSEVIAIVQLKPGSATESKALLAVCARHVARYKLPKDFIFVDHIQRSPSGKADYRWAKALAAE